MIIIIIIIIIIILLASQILQLLSKCQYLQSSNTLLRKLHIKLTQVYLINISIKFVLYPLKQC